MHTTNGGRIWIVQNTPPGQFLNATYFANNQIGWAAGPGAILFTEDGGRRWQLQNTVSNANLKKVLAIDEENAIVVGENGTILHTMDGGDHWEIVDSPAQSDLNDLATTPNGTLWIVGDSGTILRKSIDDNQWIAVEASGDNHLNAVHFITDDSGWVVGDHSTVIYTTAGGVSWSTPQEGIPLNTSFMDIDFVDENNGYLFGRTGRNGVLLKTVDGGRIWNEVKYTFSFSLGIYSVLTSLEFIDDETGFATTEGGFFRISNGGPDWKELPTDPGSNHSFCDFAIQNSEFFLVLDHFRRVYRYDPATGWEKIFNTPVGINSISLGTQHTGWIVGDSGFIAKIQVNN